MMNTHGSRKTVGLIIFFNVMVWVGFVNFQRKGSLLQEKGSIVHKKQPVTSQPHNQYLKTLCEIDKRKIAEFENNASLSPDQLRMRLHEILMDPVNLACHSKQRFGGNFLEHCKFTDGGKVACMDDLLEDLKQKKCLVFSFGIETDWTFEDMMDKLGCTIHAFDPSVDYPATRGKHITFERLGVSAKADIGQKLDTLSSILKKYNHQNSIISYLKMDIEQAELEGLPVWLASGALKNVQQIALEIHLTENVNVSVKFFETLKKLYFEGSFRLISYEPNGCFKNIDKSQDKFYRLFEIVLKKVNGNHKAKEKDCDRYD